MEVIWRRKWLVATIFLVFVVTTAVVSKTLPTVYGTTATLLIAVPAEDQTFDTVQASQALARSYADIIDSRNIAQLVADRVQGGATAGNILGASSFEPKSQTQLLKISAENSDPARAKLIADTYAEVFIEYARERLQRTTTAQISLADAAPLPDTPSRPRPTLYVLIAAFLGLAAGLAAAFIRDRLDRRLRTSEDVEAVFDIPVLARVPRRGRSESSISAFREAHRLLRTNLHFASPSARLQSIAVTSGNEGEGKTTSVAQYAIACAEVGLRVIVVEADFRRPALQPELMPDNPEALWPGLSNYLVEAASLDEVIHSTGRPNLDIVPAGPLPPSPSALLESRRGQAAMDDFLTRADIVVVDCPPLNIGADASVIASWVAGVLLVVDLQTSTDRSVRDALRQLEAVKAPVLGLLLNRDRSSEASSYDYYQPLVRDGARSRGGGARERV